MHLTLWLSNLIQKFELLIIIQISRYIFKVNSSGVFIIAKELEVTQMDNQIIIHPYSRKFEYLEKR